jgi:hypothetical protein
MEQEKYRFPDIYQQAIRGRLDYLDMVKAYKRYKVFLNVNSVRNSSTMFARRVFELLACGTPVISTYSKGISEILGENTVLITESEEDTRRHLQNLIYDDQYWWSQSLTGMRKVMESHTYHNRTQEVFSRVGISCQEAESVSFTVAGFIKSVQDAVYLSEILNKQIYRHFDLVLIPDRNSNFKDKELTAIGELFSFTKVKILNSGPEQVIQGLLRHETKGYMAVLDASQYYGKNYLRDYALAAGYSDAAIIGKRSYFTVKNQSDFHCENSESSFQPGVSLHPATLVFRKDKEIQSHLKNIVLNGFNGQAEITGLSIDPYNFTDGGRNLYEKNRSHLISKIDI